MKRVLSILACLCILFSAMSVMSVSAEEKNLIVNPGFEEDLHLDEVESAFDPYLSWTPRDFSWCKIETTTEQAHSGKKSLKVSERNYWWATGYQVEFTFAKKEPITFSCWVKLEEGSGDRFMHFCIFDKNGNDLISMMGTPAEITATDKEWRKIEGTFTPPGNIKGGFIGISYQPADSADPDQMNWAGAFYIDDVYVSSASGATAAGTGSAPIVSNPDADKPVNTTTTTKKAEATTTTTEAADATTTTTDAVDVTTTTDAADVTTTTNAADADEDEQNTSTTAPVSSDSAKDDGGSLVWLWIVLGAVVVIGAGAAVYFLVIKKSGK